VDPEGPTTDHDELLQPRFCRGAWVATQIDQYRSLGVGLKPDWVIFDPRDTPTPFRFGRSGRIVQRHARCVRHLLECDVEGWASGMASVDPSLNAGSTPRSRSTAITTWSRSPCRSSSPSPSGTAADADRRRDRFEYSRLHIFRRRLHPASTLAQEESTLLNPPWSGQFTRCSSTRACTAHRPRRSLGP